MSTPAASPSRPAIYAWLAFALTFALMLSDYMTRSVMNAVLPDLKEAFRLTDTELGVLVSIVPLIVGIGAWPVALLADRFGYVRSITAMSAVWCVATVLCGLTQTHTQMLLARAAVGMGEAGYGAVGAALLSRLFPARGLSAILGAFQAAAVFGTVLGVVLGGVLSARHGWEAAFVWVGLGSLALVVLYPVLVREPPATSGSAPESAQRMPLGAVLRALLSSPTARYTYLASGAQMFIVAAIGAWMPTFLTREYGLAGDAAGARAGLLILMVGVGMILGGVLADRAGRIELKLQLAGAYTLVAFALLAPAFALAAGPVQMGLLFVGTLFAGGHAGIVVTTIADATNPRLRATAIATVALFNNVLGLAPGPSVVGALSDAITLKAALSIAPVAGLIAAVCFMLAARSHARERRASAQDNAPTSSPAP